MTWDWKKAMNVVDDSQAATLTGGEAARREGRQGAGPAVRSAAIAWQQADSGGLSQAGGAVKLVQESDHKCAFCHGRGRLGEASVCPVCSGTGMVHVEAPAARCAFCGGKGQVPPRSNLTCWVCKGKGLVAVTLPVKACPDCHGKGKKRCESLYCPRCKGIGVVALLDAV